MLVAIDGLTRVGKTSISKKLGEKLNYSVCNSGNIYRLITLDLLENSITPKEKVQLIKRLPNIKINITPQGLYLNEKNVTNRLEDKDVSQNVLEFSTIKEIKEYVRTIQKEFISKNKNLIMEGRHISERIMPNADIKFYLYASTNKRAKRLLQKRKELTLEQAIEIIKENDQKDIASLNFLKPKNAIEIDTSTSNVDEVVDLMLEKIKNVK